MTTLTESGSYDSGIYQLETTDQVMAGAGGIANSQAQSLANRTGYLKDNDDIKSAAMSGDMSLSASPGTAGSSAAVLNAAAAGSVTVTVTVSLVDSSANVHNWSTNTLGAAIAVVIADADISAPTIDSVSPQLSSGTVDIVLTYDTDAGATKTYAAGDTITLTVSSSNILGYAISDVTFIDTIVA